jgi:hypothetical protein
MTRPAREILTDPAHQKVNKEKTSAINDKHTPHTKLTKKESKHNRKKDKNSRKIFKILRNPKLPYYLHKRINTIIL